MKQFNKEHGHSFDWTDSPNGFTGWSRTCVLQDMVDTYEMADGSMPTEDQYAKGTPWTGTIRLWLISTIAQLK